MDKTAKELLEQKNYEELVHHAFALSRQGAFEEARELYDLLYDIYGEEKGYSDYETMGVLFEHAYCDLNLGNEEQALNDYTLVAERINEQYGEGCKLAISATGQSIRILAGVSRFDEALELGQKLIMTATQELGPDSFHTATALYNTAFVLTRMKRYEDALEKYELALHILQTHCPQQKSYIIHTLRQIGGCYEGLGNYAKTVEYGEKAYEIAKEKDSYTVLDCQTYLAAAYASNEEYEKAQELFERACKEMEEISGTQSIEYLWAQFVSVDIYLALGMYQRALAVAECVNAQYQKTSGGEYYLTILSLLDLAKCCGKCREYERQMELSEEVYKRCLHVWSEEYQNTAKAQFQLACAYADMDRFPLALEIGAKAVAGLEKTSGEREPEVIPAKCFCAKVCCHMGDTALAEQYIRSAEQDLATRAALKEHRAKVESTKSYILQCKKDYSGAVSHLGKAISIMEEFLPTDHPQIRKYRRFTALNYFLDGDFDNAVRYCEESCQLSKKEDSKEPDDTDQYATEIICCLAKAKQGDEQAYARLEAIDDTKIMETSVSFALLYAKAKVLMDRGEPEQAAIYARDCFAFCEEHFEPKDRRIQEAAVLQQQITAGAN